MLRHPHSVRLSMCWNLSLVWKSPKSDYNHDLAGQYNVGPAEGLCDHGRAGKPLCKLGGDELATTQDSSPGSKLSKLDCSKLQSMLNWKTSLNIQQAWWKNGGVGKVFERVHCTARQIREYLASGNR